VAHVVQDEDCFVFAYEDGAVGVYDWAKDKLLDERTGGGLVCRSLAVSSPTVPAEQRILAVCGDKGDLSILKS